MLSTFAVPTKTMIPLYITTSMHILFGWLLESNYWMYLNEAEGLCTTWWDDREVPWFGFSFCTMTLQFLYILYLYQKYDTCKNMTAVEAHILIATFIPHLICMSTLFTNISVPLFYWLTKVGFIAVWVYQAGYYYDHSGFLPERLTYQEIIKLIQGKWILRDTCLMFTMTFYCLCIGLDIVRLYPTTILTLSYLTSFVGNWCTSLIIVMGLSSVFGFLSNSLVALSRFLVTGQKEFAAAVFDVNIGARVNLAMIVFCLEAAILTVDEETRIHNFKGVTFLTCYIIVMQIWDMTEQQFYMVANSGEKRTLSAYLRILLFAVTLTSVPVIVTFETAEYLHLDVWMLLNASGTICILCRALSSLVELVLVSVAWHVDNHLDLVEDLLYYTRLFRNFATAVTNLMLGYHRLFVPFLSQWFYIRLALIILEGLGIAQFVIYKEWIEFQSRRKFLKRLDEISDASEEQLRERNDVCSICFTEMDEGKVLQCSHIFHKACLRKLAQLQRSCPLCQQALFSNTE